MKLKTHFYRGKIKGWLACGAGRINQLKTTGRKADVTCKRCLITMGCTK